MTAPPTLATAESAPAYLLAIGLILAAIAIVLSQVSHSATVACFAWLLGGPLAIGSVAVFLQVDTQRRSHPWYADSPLIPWLRRGIILVALVAVALNAWTIADAIARKTWS